MNGPIITIAGSAGTGKTTTLLMLAAACAGDSKCIIWSGEHSETYLYEGLERELKRIGKQPLSVEGVTIIAGGISNQLKIPDDYLLFIDTPELVPHGHSRTMMDRLTSDARMVWCTRQAHRGASKSIYA